MDIENRVLYELDVKDNRKLYIEDFNTTVDLEIVGEFENSEINQIIDILTKVSKSNNN